MSEKKKEFICPNCGGQEIHMSYSRHADDYLPYCKNCGVMVEQDEDWEKGGKK